MKGNKAKYKQTTKSDWTDKNERTTKRWYIYVYKEEKIMIQSARKLN